MKNTFCLFFLVLQINAIAQSILYQSHELFDTTGLVSLSANGDIALIGSSQANNYKGKAYVFSRTNTTWSQITQINSPNGLVGDFFGIGASLSDNGQFALIGSSETIGANMEQGASYVFEHAGNIWVQKAKLIASNGTAGDNMGIRISFSGDGSTAACGIRYADVGVNQAQGRVLIFDTNAVTPIHETPREAPFRFYPSPATGLVTIESDEPIDEVCILNLMGNMVLQTRNPEFDLYGVPPGIYLMRLKINGMIYSTTVCKI